MNNYPNNNAGFRNGGKPKAEVINKCEFTGIARPKGNNQAITPKLCNNGSTVVRFTIECRETTGADEHGYPKVNVTYIPVEIWNNRNITPTMLSSISAGMKVHVVGQWSNQSYTDNSGQKKNYTVCRCYVLEILAQPQMQGDMYQQNYYQGQQPLPAQRQYPMAQPAQGAYPQPQAYPQPLYPQAAPQQYQQPARQAAPASPAPQQPATPPYYVPPGQTRQAAPQTQQQMDINNIIESTNTDDIPF